MTRAPELLSVRAITDDPKAGMLWVLNSLPFTPARLFWIEAPREAARGGHAHRRNQQLLVPVSADVNARCQWWVDGKRQRVAHYLAPGKALLLPPLVWLDLAFASRGVCAVLASEPYSAGSYVTDPAELRELSR